MSIVFAGVAPHPPLLIPDIGRTDRDRVTLTDQALKRLAGHLVQTAPDILVIISPHGPVFSDAIAIFNEPEIEGDLDQFGASHVKFSEKIDQEFTEEIQRLAYDSDIMVALMGEEECEQYRISGKLDHGTLVPLYYFREMGLNVPLIPIAMGMLPYEDLYEFGIILQKVSDRLNKKVAVIASGDLSHRLSPSAPAGYNPLGVKFDDLLVRKLRYFQIEDLFAIEDKLIEKAGECGFRPILMMLGALDGYEVKSDLISYEGPFGVGYCVAAFHPTGNTTPSKLELIRKKRSDFLKGIQEKEHSLVRLARQTIISYLKRQETLPPDVLTTEMKRKAGVFVSIKKNGQLRGCIGTTASTTENVAKEIIQNAVSAAFRDPRFYPIEEDELNNLTISVDVLGEPEVISSLKELDPLKYGVIVKQGEKTGLLLPDLEGVDTARQQVDIAKQKAGIITDENIQLYRFDVKRYH